MMRTGIRGTEAADSVRIKRPGGALFITTTVPRTSIYRKSYIRVIKRSREKTLTYKKGCRNRGTAQNRGTDLVTPCFSRYDTRYGAVRTRYGNDRRPGQRMRTGCTTVIGV